MGNLVEQLHWDEVISVEVPEQFLIHHTTFKTKELLEAIKRGLRAPEGWFNEGINCEIISPGESWRKGRVRISLEFYPDESDLIEIPAGDKSGTTQPESLLDEIRQITVEGN